MQMAKQMPGLPRQCEGTAAPATDIIFASSNTSAMLLMAMPPISAPTGVAPATAWSILRSISEMSGIR
jgi:hypothetical protein